MLALTLILPLVLVGVVCLHAMITDVSKQAQTPPPRSDAGIAFDAARGVVLVFGGHSSAQSTLTDTWSWDGSHWTQQHPAQSPPPVQHPQMVYDGEIGRVLLFDRDARLGDSPIEYQDVWAWDGATWSQDGAWGESHTPRGGPIVWDAGRGRVVLPQVAWPMASVAATEYGNIAPWLQASRTGEVALRELEWDGRWWQPGAAEQPVDGSTRLQAAVWEPGARRLLVLAATEQFHCPPPRTVPGSTIAIPDECGMIQFTPSEAAPSTCSGADVTMLMTAWELSDSGWARVAADGLPCKLGDETLVSDPTNGRAMLLGSQFVWRFTGERWQRSPLIPAMAGRAGVAVVADMQHRQVVAMGGLRGGAAGNDTWTWDGHEWSQHGGTSPPTTQATASPPRDLLRESNSPEH